MEKTVAFDIDQFDAAPVLGKEHKRQSWELAATPERNP